MNVQYINPPSLQCLNGYVKKGGFFNKAILDGSL